MNILNAFQRTFVLKGHSVEETRKGSFLAFTLLLFMACLCCFAIYDIQNGQVVEGIVLLLFIAVLAGIYFAIRQSKNMPRQYRFSGVAVLLYLNVELAMGGAEGHAFLWFYFIPSAAFYLVGNREGVLWVLASLLLSGIVLFTPLFHDYEIEIAARFVATYLIVAILSFGLEYSRNWYYQELLLEKKSLEEALREVKILQGLLPICSYCKSIRDDTGYWKQIESYIRENSEADFSHGICPACLKKHYSELYTDASKETTKPE